MTRFLVMAILSLVVYAAPAFAKEPSKEPTLPKVIEELRAKGAQTRYLGRNHGFDGWIMTANGQEQAVYVAPDKSYFFMGLMFDGNGQSLTAQQVKKIEPVADVKTPPKPDIPQVKNSEKSEAFFRDVSARATATLGHSAAPEIYMFVDPYCPHCKKLIATLGRAISAGEVKVRLIFVGALTPDSRLAAAYLSHAADAPERLVRVMAGEMNAVPVDQKADTALVDSNFQLLEKWHFTGTPVTVYRAANNQIKILKGEAAAPDLILKDLR